MNPGNSSITFRRAVVAWHDEKYRLQMNVTWVDKTINFANLTNSSCSCCNSCNASSCSLIVKLNTSVVTLYNVTGKGKQLLFLEINFHNETFNYMMYVLVYRTERSQYNFTLITRIFTDPETGEYKAFITGINIAPREDKALPVGDIVLTAENLTLSEYYWTLNEVLLKLHRNDETKWLWTRSAYELRRLSQLVKTNLPEYNQHKATGATIVMDLIMICISYPQDIDWWCAATSCAPSIVSGVINCIKCAESLLAKKLNIEACSACLATIGGIHGDCAKCFSYWTNICTSESVEPV
ncbi:hypothetical protein [Thermococcus chitonophagus]|nr:hypothetical protein [Thermococcus chitonophagus]CUX77731.1 hypothetical protein CHITON_0952 [Thermococcus chitonophagus]